MRITIVGAGNIGTQFAVHCAAKGHNVIMYGSKPERINKQLSIVDENKNIILEGNIDLATSNPDIAFKNADVIFITMPAYCLDMMNSIIFPYVHKGLKIFIVPGTGGGECVFKETIKKGAIICGLQRVPSVARLVEYGKCTCAVGYRDTLHVAAIPNKNVGECVAIIENIFDKKTIPLPNYLNITLTPSNPILHTTRLRNLYGDYHAGMVYESVPLFYEDWNNETSELLLACDDEVQEICGALRQFDLSYVKSLRIHYESPTADAITKKISSITGFKGLTSPAIKVEGGYIPDFNSRYFTADFSYGLSILIQIADLVGVNVPNMKKTLEWYYGIVGKRKEYNFSDYGINNFEKFIEFYLQ